jgi:hypothetical protein
MANTPTNALWRGGSFRLKILSVFKSDGQTALSKMLFSWRDPRQSYPHMTDRQARDIGLDPADLEWSRLQLPSKTQRHPML